MEVWKPVHGQCVKYRKEHQSCIEQPIAFDNPAFNSPYPRMPNGKVRAGVRAGERGASRQSSRRAGGGVQRRPGPTGRPPHASGAGPPCPPSSRPPQVYLRPLICDPKGGPDGSPLICTPPDYEVMPSTCVPARPANQCFSGPWWISTDCPRTSKDAPKAGLTKEQVSSAASTAMLMYQGEVAFAASCAFWDTSKPMGQSVLAAREQLYAIMGALWPTDLVGPPPTLEELMAPWDVSSLTDDMAACYEDEGKPGSAVAKKLAMLGDAASQPNKVWSLVHWTMHNQPEPMTTARAQVRPRCAGGAGWAAVRDWRRRMPCCPALPTRPSLPHPWINRRAGLSRYGLLTTSG